jgi:hypothetical protein
MSPIDEPSNVISMLKYRARRNRLRWEILGFGSLLVGLGALLIVRLAMSRESLSDRSPE